MFLALLAALIGLAFPSPVPMKDRIEKLAEGVHVHLAEADSDAVSNAGLVILQNSVLIFDSHATPEAGQRLLAEIRELTPKPVRYVVNSHHHADHTHGNQALGPAQIIAATNSRRNVLQRDIPSMNFSLGLAQSQLEKMQKEVLQAANVQEQNALKNKIRERREFVDRMARLKILVPTMTVDERLDLHDSTRNLELLYLGRGHTDGDLVLFIPKDRIVFTGDLFYNSALPYAQDAYLLEWIATLGELLKLEADVFVPGHGPYGTRDNVKEFKNYLEDLKALVEPGIARGDSMQQILRDVRLPPRYASYGFQNFFQANLQKMYVELKSQPPPPPAPDAAKKPNP
jgi:glyoxylase-like metal-dependent hydrolase (beta-lactamase superfamily II)